MQRKLAIGLSSGLMLSTCLAAPARAQDIGGIINMFMNAAPRYGYHMRYSAPRRHYGYAYSYSPRRHYGYGYGYGYGHAYGYGYGLRRPYGEPGQPNASPENPTSTSDQNLVTNPTNPAPSVVGAADLIGARPPLCRISCRRSRRPRHMAKSNLRDRRMRPRRKVKS